MDPPSPTSENQSPQSSRTTSPSASPNANRHPASPHHLFNLSFDPTSQPKDDEHSLSTQNPHTISVLPCAVLRGRSSMMLLRRRPSAVDMALHEERSRCDGNAIERQGLDLMEPRPVDMRIDIGGSLVRGMNETAAANANTTSTANGSAGANARTGCGRVPFQRQSQRQYPKNQNQNQSQPPFVMGGIFEVMEGQA